jgi:hypothetical protein
MTQYDFERAWLRGNPYEGKQTCEKTHRFQQKNLQEEVANFLEQVEAIQEWVLKK